MEVTELAHRLPQPLGLGGIGRHEIPRQIRDTRHPVDGFGRERVYVTECATTEIKRRKSNFATDRQTLFHIRTSRRISTTHPSSTTTIIQRCLFMADGGKKDYKETRLGRSLAVRSPFLNDEKPDIMGPIHVRSDS